ncbi:unnamed protein product [Heligmosomoides polygyrus]|uniref:SCP domain-containing protein n=1 Tax=Heligmosomoides polygyrus TaxID=6339 RepID=A0A3P7XCT8_HELPZ|nr:unnamed protein product [Heligmosomoides polygyrus]
MFIVDLAALLAVVAVVTECQSTGYEPPFGCTGTEITDTDRGDVLFAINDLRQRVAQGQEIGLNFASLPASNEMYKMKYDCDLEELAKQAVDGCPATPAPPPSHGMNVAKVPASQTPGYDAFDGWYIQSENVQIPPTAAMIASYSEFLNMVVGTSYALGCSKAACPGTSDEMVACVFQAPGLRSTDNNLNNDANYNRVYNDNSYHNNNHNTDNNNHYYNHTYNNYYNYTYNNNYHNYTYNNNYHNYTYNNNYHNYTYNNNYHNYTYNNDNKANNDYYYHYNKANNDYYDY